MQGQDEVAPCMRLTRLPHLAQCIAKQSAHSCDLNVAVAIIGRVGPLAFHRRHQGLQLLPRVEFIGPIGVSAVSLVHAAALVPHAEDGLLDKGAHRAGSIGVGSIIDADEVAEGQIRARARQDAFSRQKNLRVVSPSAPRIQAAIEVEASRTF